MKLSVEIMLELLALLECIPPEKAAYFVKCLLDVKEGRQKYGTIQLSIAPGPKGTGIVKRIKQEILDEPG
ncbi:MAG: hypothetical protein PHF74_05645 [Dehalococcoidales bacterium]|nr:hypothetical protein [Dehalococcoidales bacterium]